MLTCSYSRYMGSHQAFMKCSGAAIITTGRKFCGCCFTSAQIPHSVCVAWEISIWWVERLAELPSKQPLGSFLVAFSSTHLVGCMPIHEPEGWQQAPDMMHILTVVLEDQAFKFTERTTSFLCAEHKVPQHEFNFLHFQHVQRNKRK